MVNCNSVVSSWVDGGISGRTMTSFGVIVDDFPLPIGCVACCSTPSVVGAFSGNGRLADSCFPNLCLLVDRFSRSNELYYRL